MIRGFKKIAVSLFFFIVLILIVLIRYDENSYKPLIIDFLTRFVTKKHELEQAVKYQVSSKLTKVELMKQNEMLLVELDLKDLKLRQYELLKNENKELRRELGIMSKSDLDLIAASIIGKDPVNSGREFRIDKGKRHGIKTGFAVLAKGFLFGRIIESSNDTSTVLTILDPNCKISVRIVNTHINGILFGGIDQQWKQNPLCIIKYLPRDRKLHAGMQIETSSLGNEIPAGIPVGTLKRDDNNNVTYTIDHLYKTANMKPLDISQSIEHVTVVTK